MGKIKKVLVVGGAGYVGSALVPKLLKAGYKVRVFDLYLYSKSKRLGKDIFGEFINDKNLEQIKGDVRNAKAIDLAVKGMDAVIHLACISNDPSFDLDPNLGKSINYLAFFPFLKAINKYKTKRLVYASTASVYGVKKEELVTEDLPLEPLTDYGLYKVFCEKALVDHVPLSQTTWVILRPSTVHGYAPRLRLDLSVNILTNHAVNKGVITVFGGKQERPNVHIDEIAELYQKLLQYPDKKIAGKIFNAGNENLSIMQIAKIVKKVVGKNIKIKITPSDDLRSYRVSSEKIRKELGWEPKLSVEDGVRNLVTAFKEGKIPNSFDDPMYFNIKRMQQAKLK
ncbi:MAG: NAD(P)-dependent oxidoreductase [bacterium]|nr:NAD(P)-dependent oxidoreductase [bacterium]